MRKRCKRKVWMLVDPIRHAIEGSSITPDNKLMHLQIRELKAIELMSSGNGTVHEWKDIVDALNISETMASRGIGAEALPSIKIAHEELLIAARRYEKTNRMGLSGVGIKSVRDVLEYHHLQRTGISRSEYEKMIALTIKRIRSNHKDVVTV